MALPTPIIPYNSSLVNPLIGVGVKRRSALTLKNLIRTEFNGAFDDAFHNTVDAERAAAAIAQALTDYSPWLLNEQASLIRFNIDQWQNIGDDLTQFATANSLIGAGFNAAFDEIGTLFFTPGEGISTIKVVPAAHGVSAGGVGNFLLMAQDRNFGDGPYIILADLLRVVPGQSIEFSVTAALGLDAAGGYHAYSGGTWPTTAKNVFLINVLEYDETGTSTTNSTNTQLILTASSGGGLATYKFTYVCTSASVRYVQLQLQCSANVIGGAGVNDTYVQIHDVVARRTTGTLGLAPIGSIIGWTNHLATTPTDDVDLTTYTGKTWHACDGTTVTDPASPLNGAMLPNLNSTTNPIFLGGHATTLTVSAIQAAALLTHTHVFTGTGMNPATHQHEISTSATTGGTFAAVAANNRIDDGLGGKTQAVSAGIPQGTNANAGGSADNNYPKHQSVIWIIRIK